MDKLEKEDLPIASPKDSTTGDPCSILSESKYTHVHKLFYVTVDFLEIHLQKPEITIKW